MERTYARGASGKRAVRHRAAPGRGRRRVELGIRERRRLSQLTVCIVLFLAVFIGRGVFPERMGTFRTEVLELIRADTDFKAVFAAVGQAVERGEPLLDTLEAMWQGELSVESAWLPYTLPVEEIRYREELKFLGSSHTVTDVLLRSPLLAAGVTATAPAEENNAETAQETPVEQPPERVVYDGPPLPDNATMEHMDLGLTDTTSPVVAVVSSQYGWREHPIDGEEKFHAGVDLAAPYGDPIGAFADGVVDYIGESPAYGQYLQLRHDGGVTTFYAHCSRLCVQQGQQVAKGEKVAEVGDTGNVTGTHLHFELRLNGELLNPLYYIAYVEEE